jgi:hypothetical protein
MRAWVDIDGYSKMDTSDLNETQANGGVLLAPLGNSTDGA